MAQYLEVLSQEKVDESGNRFYANLDGTQTVQYVITPDDHQRQFQTQQIVLVDGDQLQTVPTQYVGQQEGQIFYMEQASNQQLQVIQQVTPQQTIMQTVTQPQKQVVLNQVLPQQPTIRLPAQIRVTHTPAAKVQPRPQILNQMQNRTPIQQQQRARPTLVAQRQVYRAQNPQTPKPEDKEQQQAVALPDGTIVSVAAYKRLIAEQKNKIAQNSQQQQQRLNTSSEVSPPPNGTAAGVPKRRPANPRPTQRKPINPRVPKGGIAGPRPPIGQSCSFEKDESSPPRHTGFQQQKNQFSAPSSQIQKASQANYLIVPPAQQKMRQQQLQQQQQKLPYNIPSSQIQQIIAQTPASAEYSDSIRMLVLLESGEQRLITFTLPKEACTIVEILEQVNVPFSPDTNIQVTEANASGINYIVTVGDIPQIVSQDENCESGEGEQMQNSSQPATEEPPKCASPEQPKLIPGKFALCNNCGYLSEDFNKCTRCNRKLPEDVKAIPNKANLAARLQDARNALAEKKALGKIGPKNANPVSPKKKAKPKVIEHETVCLVSSDEEDDDDSKPVLKPNNEQLISKLGASISICPISKEPSLTDIQKHIANQQNKIVSCSPEEEIKHISMHLGCRTVRIGSYRFIPIEKVLIDSSGITIKAPLPNDENEIRTVHVDHSDIVRVLASFNKSLPVIFYYLTPSVGVKVREILGMDTSTKVYFNPLSEKEESHKRITLLPEEISEDERLLFQEIYSGPSYNLLDELTPKEANDILVKTCPKDFSNNTVGMTEIKQILQYPPEGRGRLTINTEDYICLASDQFLNDVIIDFYLKYLVNSLEKSQQDKVHVFSTFFYKRLTTKPQKASRKCQPSELDNTLTAAQKRHARVKTWTKNVNLFEKDFIIVPINEHAHWFLAIICFPGMDGCHTFDGQPYKLEPKTVKKKKPVALETPAQVAEKMVLCDDPDLSDKDEAEGDESEMDSDDSDSSTPSTPITPPTPTASPVKQPKIERPPIKQPCILIFDSLAGSSRSRVVATLRDYLTCEYKAKMEKEKIYNKDNIKGSNVKVPQQTNFTDCGLYLLQYVEQFFADPIVDYYIPIKQLRNWFEEIIVTKKREDISDLIKTLMKEYNLDCSILPKIKFPTINGKLIERQAEDTEEDEEDLFEEPEGSSFEDEEFDREPGEIIVAPRSSVNADNGGKPGGIELNLFKPSGNIKNNEFKETTVTTVIKPDIAEFPRQTSDKDTLNYLKAKRIIRHKTSDGPDTKKSKND